MSLQDEVVLFIHSTGTTPAMWAGVPPEAVGGRAQVLPANLGYPPGDAIPRGRVVTPADDAEHILLALPADAKRVHVVAHSYGGLVALHALQRLGARVASVFIYEPVVFGFLMQTPDASPEALAQGRYFADENIWFLEDVERGGGRGVARRVHRLLEPSGLLGAHARAHARGDAHAGVEDVSGGARLHV